MNQEAIDKGHAEGRAEGHAEGRAKGHAEGRAKGHAEGHAEGRAEMIKLLTQLQYPCVSHNEFETLTKFDSEDTSVVDCIINIDGFKRTADCFFVRVLTSGEFEYAKWVAKRGFRIPSLNICTDIMNQHLTTFFTDLDFVQKIFPI